ncbi:Chloroplastic group IIA intron splicing facilitator CRS1, chloroplastic [Morella rubra]|uniref:Chloroplastic group IIA intron splicing facilitator CRS1, chloroplastic n=1 Tax=Morella rubra TaxID=262757 RepID=A0A6A1VL20_9ROSI|nr:Chloroplastic group IIA intron splicing facilitator CRS1, chloroplastic [Morella rubra]
MAFTTAKISELPLRSSLPLTSHSHTHSLNLLFSAAPNLSFHILKPFSSLRTSTSTTEHGGDTKPKPSPTPKPRANSAPWLNKWPSPSPRIESHHDNRKANSKNVASSNDDDRAESRYFDRDKGQSAIERIVLRLRNLGLGSDGDEDELEEMDGGDAMPVTGEERLGDLLRREWVRPDFMLAESESGRDDTVLPWERDEEKVEEGVRRREKRVVVKAPSLAELTIEDEELRRLRGIGMRIRERISIPKAGLTKEVLEKIHGKWRKEELVRLKFHEVLAHDMKTAHEIVEVCKLIASSHGQRRTGGLVLWRSGSVMVVYRGSNYEGPPRSLPVDREGDGLFVPDVSSADSSVVRSGNSPTSSLGKKGPALRNPDPPGSMTEEEVEYNSLLEGLGPRFVEWWGTGVLPVDADLLPEKVPGYKTPFRLLPTGMRSRLTNAEVTNLRKLAKSLPCHFALGRNRNHQGLASAIIKLWEKSLVVKLAVKRGIQNTNNKLMAEEIKNLTGGVLLLRNKYYIVIYRGKDFLPTSVAAALAERQEVAKQIQDVEERVRCAAVDVAQSGEVEREALLTSVTTASAEKQELAKQSPDAEEEVQSGAVKVAQACEKVEEKVQFGAVDLSQAGEDEGQALAGTLAEFYEAQARWGREISAEEREKMVEEASKAKRARLVKRIEHKLVVAQAKKLRAERLLAKIEASMIPAGPDHDQETITDEERVMFRRVGLRMKAYLPLGIRGVFDGVIENMHLHWKHRELVKLISKQKTLAFVEDTARLLEYESGGILVAIERVPKGYALIYYRGKNYRRPISIRPRNLLTKAKALKRSVAMQRHEALSQHISELERTIEQMKKELGVSQDADNVNGWSSQDPDEIDNISEITQGEDEASCISSGGEDDEEDSEWEEEEDYDTSSIGSDHHPLTKNG